MARGVVLVKSSAFGQHLLATLAFFLLLNGGAGRYPAVRCLRHHRFLEFGMGNLMEWGLPLGGISTDEYHYGTSLPLALFLF